MDHDLPTWPNSASMNNLTEPGGEGRPLFEAGMVRCARCGELIKRGGVRGFLRSPSSPRGGLFLDSQCANSTKPPFRMASNAKR
jgi:hypothetical protein